MEYRDVEMTILAIKLDMGFPFSGMDIKKPDDKTKAKTFKYDIEDLLEDAGAVQNFYVRNEWILAENNTVKITVKALPIEPKTFKFFGMDITEDLDVVIKGRGACIYIGNLANKVELVKMVMGYYASLDNKEAVMGKLFDDKELMREIITTIKFNLGKYLKGERFEAYNILKDYLKTGNVQKFDFSSIILNILKSAVDKSNPTKDDRVVDTIHILYSRATLDHWKNLADYTKRANAGFGFLSKYLNVESAMYTGTYVRKLLDESTKKGSPVDVNYFSGFCKDNSPFGNNVGPDIGSTLLGNLRGNISSTIGLAPFYSPEPFMATMFDFPCTSDINDFDMDKCTSLTVLDAIKFTDEDATFVLNNYDVNKPEDRQNLYNNVLKVYKQKYEGYIKDNNIDIGKDMQSALLNVAIPSVSNAGTPDILNPINKKDLLATGKSDAIVISKRALVDTCKLIDKVCKRIETVFKIK